MPGKNNGKSSIDWQGLIAGLPLFKTVKVEDIELILSEEFSRKHVFSADKTILKQGEAGSAVYILCSGAISVLLEKPGQDPVQLYTLKDGDIFGEMALFGRNYRTATLVTSEPCKVIEIEGDNFLSLMRKHNEIAIHLLTKLSQRLRHTDDLILTQQVANIDNALAKMQNQIDTVVQANDAKLTAAQTMYDQTSKRATDITTSAEAARTRMTWITSTAAGILALVFGAGFLNFDSARREIANQRQQIATIHERIVDLKGKVNSDAVDVKAAAEEAVAAAQGAVASEESAKVASARASDVEAEIHGVAKETQDMKKDIDEIRQKAFAAYFDTILQSFRNDLEVGLIKDATATHFIDLISKASREYGDNVRNQLYELVLVKDPKERELSLDNLRTLLKQAAKQEHGVEVDVHIAYFSGLAGVIGDDLPDEPDVMELNARLMAAVGRTNRDFERLLLSGANEPAVLKRRIAALAGVSDDVQSGLLQDLFASLKATP